MDAWLNFARNGNPSTRTLPGWPQYRADRSYTIVPSLDVKTITADRETELTAWRAGLLTG